MAGKKPGLFVDLFNGTGAVATAAGMIFPFFLDDVCPNVYVSTKLIQKIHRQAAVQSDHGR